MHLSAPGNSWYGCFWSMYILFIHKKNGDCMFVYTPFLCTKRYIIFIFQYVKHILVKNKKQTPAGSDWLTYFLFRVKKKRNQKTSEALHNSPSLRRWHSILVINKLWVLLSTRHALPRSSNQKIWWFLIIVGHSWEWGTATQRLDLFMFDAHDELQGSFACHIYCEKNIRFQGHLQGSVTLILDNCRAISSGPELSLPV